MDYEKMYKEALDDMRVIYPNLKGEAKLAVEHAFPELAESEEERIRKKMIEHFKSKTKDIWCNMPVKSIIAWLEKQKEQNPAEWSEEDEEMLNSIIMVVCGIGVQPSNGLREKQVRFLKSHLPSWKPSEEQMTNLLRAEGRLRIEGENVLASKLAEIYEQLKKL